MNEQTRWASHTYKLVAVLLISFSLYTAAFGVFPDVIQRGKHLALAIILVYLGIITNNRTLVEYPTFVNTCHFWRIHSFIPNDVL